MNCKMTYVLSNDVLQDHKLQRVKNLVMYSQFSNRKSLTEILEIGFRR
jgi:hypothetical protein